MVNEPFSSESPPPTIELSLAEYKDTVANSSGAPVVDSITFPVIRSDLIFVVGTCAKEMLTKNNKAEM
jgi:hypothetical protein